MIFLLGSGVTGLGLGCYEVRASYYGIRVRRIRRRLRLGSWGLGLGYCQLYTVLV